MVATGQEMVRGKNILQGRGKVSKFHFKSRRSEILREHIYSFRSTITVF